MRALRERERACRAIVSTYSCPRVVFRMAFHVTRKSSSSARQLLSAAG